MGRADSYQKSTWSLGDKYIKEYNEWFLEQQTEFLLGRYQIDFRRRVPLVKHKHVVLICTTFTVPFCTLRNSP